LSPNAWLEFTQRIRYIYKSSDHIMYSFRCYRVTKTKSQEARDKPMIRNTVAREI